jgi:hypothetical protein
MAFRTIQHLATNWLLFFLCWVATFVALAATGGVGTPELFLMLAVLIVGFIVVSRLTLRHAKASVTR